MSVMIMVVAIIEKPGVLVKVGDRPAVDYDGCARLSVLSDHHSSGRERRMQVGITNDLYYN
jgi:hypothetical protein